MRNLYFVSAVAFATLLQACSTPKPAKEPDGVSLDRPQAFIPFMNQRSSVYSFQADGREGLWVEDGNHKWYYGTFLGPCIGIENAVALGFDTGTSDRLDRYSHVLVPRERDRCPLMSFTESDPPPDGDRHSLASEEVKK